MLYPSKVKELKRYLSQKIILDPYTDDRSIVEYNCRNFLGLVGNKKLKRMNFTEEEKIMLDKYSLYLANNQLNEACNRLWIIIELLNVTSPKIWKAEPVSIKDLEHRIKLVIAGDIPEALPYDLSEYIVNSYPRPLGENFSPDYISGTTIPSLYFSQISIILSVLSSYGCILVRDKRKSEIMKLDPQSNPRQRDYVLVRKEEDWELLNRRSFIAQKLPIRLDSIGWHIEIMKIFEGFRELGVEFPSIDMDSIDELRDLRIQTHYEVMGEVTAKSIMGNITTLKYIPKCFLNLENAIKHLREVWKITNNCDSRIENLKKKLPSLFQSYGYNIKEFD